KVQTSFKTLINCIKQHSESEDIVSVPQPSRTVIQYPLRSREISKDNIYMTTWSVAVSTC
nr:hypothetical protein [Tanacetum cinerariifolium]